MSETVGKPIKCKAAVCWAAGEPLKVEEVEVAPPGPHEVRIHILHTGICHTDEYTRSGKDSEVLYVIIGPEILTAHNLFKGVFPVILGHEGGGIVESIGEGVTSVAVAIMSFLSTPPNAGNANLQEWKDQPLRQRQILSLYLCSGPRLTSTTRFTCKGQAIHHFMGTSTFSQYTVVADVSVVAVDPKAPLGSVCLLGCGITTAWGAVVKQPGIKGSNVAVFGCGAIGLGVIATSSAVGAARIIAVDTNPGKEAWARKFGATEFVNPAQLPEGTRIQDYLVEITDGGLDFTFDATGNVNVMRAALEACHKGWGVSTVIGVAAAGQEISTRPFQLVTGRVWRDYLQGKVKVDEYVTHHRKLEDINEGFNDMHGGDCIRCVVDMS
ncbi:S-(hydroxymethyl)glutathione dehydrogenase [Grifola frondosa]|uniref:S-(Hydroxymethyl)glutathione dehydrogenase n=1 Tax=Grifola frondosa TaxID=5627 RepID=A0A1C7MHY4_GRIFR|nr:S-(hydroxymethyl)glutathione dehydrogenase [Grifola frondosa]